MYTLVYEFGAWPTAARGGGSVGLKTCQPGDLCLAETAAALAGGALAILPTDTVYGICADVRRDEAVRAIYTAKGKGEAAPLQLLFADAAALVRDYATMTPSATHLMSRLGPGPWTIITPASQGWASPALAGGRTVGVRIPDAAVVQKVVTLLGAPLAASSANRHGEPSPTTCADAISQVGAVCEIAVDAGPTPQGIDSTVIDCSTDDVRILREGAIDRHTIARILGLSEIPVLRSVRQ
ncbi:MAG: L-threonylcarbamoyladenylate synthase [Anaerolineales bacterium]